MPDRSWGDYVPLRIVAHLSSPIAMLPHDPLPLDGILEFAAFRLGYPPVMQYTGPDGHRLPRITDRDPANFRIPVKRIGHKTQPDWYWSASWAFFPHGMEMDRQHWNKRFDGARTGMSDYLTFAGRSERIGVSSGRYKSHHRPLSLVVARAVEWYALGAPGAILTLLNAITQLGHKRSQGYGEVKCWEVWPARHDWSCWRDGQPMRAIPVAEGQPTHGMATAHTAVRSPAWHPSRRRLCLVPQREIAAIGLK